MKKLLLCMLGLITICSFSTNAEPINDRCQETVFGRGGGVKPNLILDRNEAYQPGHVYYKPREESDWFTYSLINIDFKGCEIPNGYQVILKDIHIPDSEYEGYSLYHHDLFTGKADQSFIEDAFASIARIELLETGKIQPISNYSGNQLILAEVPPSENLVDIKQSLVFYAKLLQLKEVEVGTYPQQNVPDLDFTIDIIDPVTGYSYLGDASSVNTSAPLYTITVDAESCFFSHPLWASMYAMKTDEFSGIGSIPDISQASIHVFCPGPAIVHMTLTDALDESNYSNILTLDPRSTGDGVSFVLFDEDMKTPLYLGPRSNAVGTLNQFYLGTALSDGGILIKVFSFGYIQTKDRIIPGKIYAKAILTMAIQ